MSIKNECGTALITGAARRIGRTIALELARQGWQVAIHHHSSEKDADTLIEEIEAIGARAVKIKRDLADPEQLESLVPQCANLLEAPTCIVNNASAFEPDHIPHLGRELWDAHLAINLKAPVFLAQYLVRHLPAKTPGNVINIIDQRVWRPTPDFFSYTISKAGLWTATQTLAQALAPRVRVNAVGPGPVLKSVHQSDEEFAEEVQSTLLKQAPKPEDIARAVLFILQSPAMTGQMIALDSGQHLVWSGEKAS